MRKKLITTSTRGIRETAFPYQLYQKAKKFGAWNPQDIDFTQDKEDWKNLSTRHRDWIIKLLAQFQGGEEAVTHDLLPLLKIASIEGRIEEELFLTTFLYDEAKHTELFRKVLDELGEREDLTHLHSKTYRKFFYEILPDTMEQLWNHPTPEALADAATVYNMFSEGVLAETGYKVFSDGLNKMGIMPGLLKGIEHLKKDESRHIAYGTYLLQRLISEHPQLFDRVIKKMEELAPLALALNEEGMAFEEDEKGKTATKELMNFSKKQLMTRIEILSRAKTKSIDELYPY
ncbi:R2-like ligand-binding oxidase [Metabacillus halosaccharovorans]|uniref:R2-like ligand-binding oxidase n=1 Tax=Metabacillus halosaccharovorans TaxID=930124 RepID=UPI00203DC21E|nr:R2-like ligand-binding oxidase [Metabacillus halosaccharovorans]MCM3442736.1 R2-like ligand-binding oxidase [Metabacillus halosaccharovorans]